MNWKISFIAFLFVGPSVGFSNQEYVDIWEGKQSAFLGLFPFIYMRFPLFLIIPFIQATDKMI